VIGRLRVKLTSICSNNVHDIFKMNPYIYMAIPENHTVWMQVKAPQNVKLEPQGLNCLQFGMMKVLQSLTLSLCEKTSIISCKSTETVQ